MGSLYPQMSLTPLPKFPEKKHPDVNSRDRWDDGIRVRGELEDENAFDCIC